MRRESAVYVRVETLKTISHGNGVYIFKGLKKKYIKPYYYQRPSMKGFIEIMNTKMTKNGAV